MTVAIRNLIIGTILLGGIYSPTVSTAQESNNSWRDFEYVRSSEAWLSGYNASGLVYLPESVRTISIAEIYALKNNGGFINYSQSDNSFTAGAYTESFFRLNKQVVFYGKVEYRNFTGQNMAGSAFINPEENVFNIMDPEETDRGRKNLEQYHLFGAIGIRLAPRFSIGAKVDYIAANYAKHKDLRHKNSLLDLTATAGAAYQVSNAIEIGVNYVYKRRIEAIEFETFGSTGRMYSSLIDFGAFYGRTELFGESGFTSKRRPAVDMFNGAALQVNLRLSPQWRFFNEFSGLLRSGYFGTHGSADLLAIEHEGTALAYTGDLSFTRTQQQHSLKLNFNYDRLENNEIISQPETTPGSGTEYIIYGNTKVLDKRLIKAGLKYTANLKVQDFCPEWVLSAGGNYTNRQQITSLYPFFREQDIYWWDAYLSAGKHITVRKNQYGITLNLLYGSGGGEPHSDGTYTPPAAASRLPYSSDKNLIREYEYLTAERITGAIGGSYARRILPNIRLYVRAEYALTNAFNVEKIENKLHAFTVAIGCNF